jgi:heme/copper-type cytochrome/quinol oxidase subunit 2
MITVLIIYWIATTIYGTYWAVKNPPIRLGSDSEYFTLLEVIAKIFPAMCIAWIAVPAMLLHQIKFKRKRKIPEAGEVFARQADMSITFEKKKHE